MTAAGGPAVSAFARGLHGSIGFQGCIGAASGCTPTSPSDAFAYPGDLVVTPDGKQIEVTSSSIANHGTLSTLARDTATGLLSFLACSGAVTGCQQVSPPDAMEGAAPLALTGDGKLDVGATSTSTIARFSVYSGGTLFGGCTGQTSGCLDPGPAGRPAIPLDVAVLPDGKHVVIADGGSADGGGIRLYRRKELVSCPDPPAATTVSGSAVDVTLTCSDPDGDSVAYVASSAPAHGSVAQPRNGTFTYTPAADYVGDDSFGVFVQEPDGGTTVTVHVSVQAAPPASGSGSHGGSAPGGGPGSASGGGSGTGSGGGVVCTVPKLLTTSLATAKKRLSKAHCATGKVKKKRAPRHARLIVVAQSPKAGRKLARGTKVKLTLGPARKR